MKLAVVLALLLAGADRVACGGGSSEKVAAAKKTGSKSDDDSSSSSSSSGSGDQTGTDATELGKGCSATGDYALASGSDTIASGEASFATGTDTGAIGIASFVGGMGSQAKGDYATGFGYNTYANGEASVAIGHSCVATGMAATAFGHYTEAIGSGSLAIGHITKAIARGSVSGGWSSDAIGEESFAFGSYCEAKFDYSAAFGYGVSSTMENEVAVGQLRAEEGVSSPSYAVAADSRLSSARSVSTGLREDEAETAAPREALVSLVRALRPRAVETARAWYEAGEDANAKISTTVRPALLVADEDVADLDGVRVFADGASADAGADVDAMRWSVLSRAPGFARSPHAYAENVAASPSEDGTTCRVALKMADGTPHGLEAGQTVRLQLEATGAAPLYAKGDARGAESSATDGSGVVSADAAPRAVPADAVVSAVVGAHEFMATIDEPCAAGMTSVLVSGPWVEDLKYLDVGAVTAALVGTTHTLLDERDAAKSEHEALRDELAELRASLTSLHAALGSSSETTLAAASSSTASASATASATLAPLAAPALLVAAAVGAALAVRRRMRLGSFDYTSVPSGAEAIAA